MRDIYARRLLVALVVTTPYNARGAGQGRGGRAGKSAAERGNQRENGPAGRRHHRRGALLRWSGAPPCLGRRR
jgi:hypothetical protein